ncbi:MAG: zinc ribbon domain-containing protein, partial [Candidatus Aminicenantes bacterium]|nr:zinc ribbon domain-containing protein [Candidatus Aminicenantes bacterium]
MAINCPRCRADNPGTQRFCGECGTPLPSGNPVQGPDAPRPGGIPPNSMTETLQTPVRELTTGFTFAGRYQVIEEL